MIRRSPSGFAVLFVVAALLYGFVQLPLALVLKVTNAPISAERVTGTIWNGQLGNAWVTGYPAGDIWVSGHFMPLLTGRVAADITMRGAIANGVATVSLGLNSLHLQDTKLTVDLATLDLQDAFGAPMAGLVSLETPGITINRTACVEGTLSITTDTLEKTARRYGGEGFTLAGQGQCQDDAFLLPLQGEGADGRAEANIRVALAGYTTEFIVTPQDPSLEEVLRLYGFQQRGDSFSLIQRGEIF